MNTVSTGIKGLDQVIDKLRLGDNVVWQVDSLEDYRKIVNPYMKQALKDTRNVIYIRFGTHEPIILENSNVILINVDEFQKKLKKLNVFLGLTVILWEEMYIIRLII